jgi:uncharacterized membrane protein
MTQRWQLNLIKLRVLIIILLLVGVFFRFYNLDRKVYWHDETFTSLRISGYTSKELFDLVFDGRIINREDLQKFQRVNPEKNLIDTLKSLAIEDPQHPPLYYVLLRWWVQIFGNSVATIRSFSALISLLVFPCIYWLCWELFGTPLVGWVAIALISISPFHLVYAQEAREYILWMVTILLSSAALLRAMRLKTKQSWVIYAITLAIGWYTFLLTGLVAIGQGIYVWTIERFRFSQIFISYLLASLAAIIAFAPWIWVVLTNFSIFHQTTQWTGEAQFTLPDMVKGWCLQLSYLFVDFNFYYAQPEFKYFVLPSVLALCGTALYMLCRRTPQKTWLFLLVLIGSIVIPMMLPDLVFGGVRSITNRYLIPYFLGIQLAIAYLLATQISQASFFTKKLWQAIMAILISVGIFSCIASSQSQAWWHKFPTNNIPKVAQILEKSHQPLLLSSLYNNGANLGNLFSLSYLIPPQVKLQIVARPIIPKIPPEFDDIFLFNPSEKLRLATQDQRQSKAKIIWQDRYITLWKLKKK